MHACMLIAMPVVTDIFYNSNESKLLNNPKYFVVPTLGVWCALYVAKRRISQAEGWWNAKANKVDRKFRFASYLLSSFTIGVWEARAAGRSSIVAHLLWNQLIDYNSRLFIEKT
eukprot:SAG31_NODE_210_length_20286_cov_22.684748_15_plen_114_part_00